MSEPQRPTCATCAYYDLTTKASNPMPQNLPPAHPGGPHPWGYTCVCRKSPCLPRRSPEDWCAVHQDFPAYLAALKREAT